MELKGRYRIAADRETVWSGLNDPAILEKAIPGCQAFAETTDEGGARSFEATVRIKLGPVAATFKGAVSLENVNAPESYTLRGEGKGGVAGFGKGAADVTLSEAEDATILAYNADAQVGGKLAQIGSRLIKGSVKKLAGEFFTAFAAAIDAEWEELPAEEGEA